MGASQGGGGRDGGARGRLAGDNAGRGRGRGGGWAHPSRPSLIRVVLFYPSRPAAHRVGRLLSESALPPIRVGPPSYPSRPSLQSESALPPIRVGSPCWPPTCCSPRRGTRCRRTAAPPRPRVVRDTSDKRCFCAVKDTTAQHAAVAQLRRRARRKTTPPPSRDRPEPRRVEAAPIPHTHPGRLVCPPPPHPAPPPLSLPLPPPRLGVEHPGHRRLLEQLLVEHRQQPQVGQQDHRQELRQVAGGAGEAGPAVPVPGAGRGQGHGCRGSGPERAVSAWRR